MASLTVYQTAAIILRRRDRQGRLVRTGGSGDLPRHVLDSMDADGNRRVRKKVALGEAYVRAKMARHKLSEDEAVAKWKDYLRALQEERAALNAARRGKK